MKKSQTCRAIAFAATAALCGAAYGQTPTAEALVSKLVEKGILTDAEAKQVMGEAAQTNRAPASKWKLNDAVKSLGLYGDVRFRYEYRSAENAPGSGQSGSTYYRSRLRYSVRVGIQGDLFDDFYYGLRIETGSNPRSPWVTFGDDTNPTPSAKNSDGVSIGQAFLGWRPATWLDLTLGRMPMPLVVTPMIWDADIQPEGAAEKFTCAFQDVDLFATFGQFLYQDSNSNNEFPAGNPFLLAWQLGANVKVSQDKAFKVAPVFYTYTGFGQNNGLNQSFSGQGSGGLNPNTPGFNQNGINDLLILEVPAEFNFSLAGYRARIFGDFAFNFSGDNRARAAAAATAPAGNLPYPVTGQNTAYQLGLGYGNLGLVYGQTSKRNTWEGRVYWQHIEQYAADVNLLDSDFLEGRANLQGVYVAFTYSFTDAILGTVRYGYAQLINPKLGTGGNNSDLYILNPINYYNLFQFDVTCRF